MTRRTRFLAPIAALAAVLLGVVALGSPAGASRQTSSRIRTSAPSCGTTIYKSDGSKWVCTFDDEFAGSSLDTTKWSTWNDVNYWSASEPNVCYYDDSQHLSERYGYLQLAVTRLPSSATCQTLAGTTHPTYGAAVINSKGKFSQTMGRFEARIKFAGGVGLHDDFWLYPAQTTYPGKAEIDIAEPYGALPDTMNAVTHVTGPDGTDVGGWGACAMTNWAGAFHTYAVDWTATSITFSYDDQTCYTFSNWTPMTGYTAPAPFNQDFFMILQVLADNGVSAPAPDATTALPATMQVDWVRVWK